MSALRRLVFAVLVIASSGGSLAQGIDGARSTAWQENPPSLLVPDWPAPWSVASRSLPASGQPTAATRPKQSATGVLLGRGQRLSASGAAPISSRDLVWHPLDGGGRVARFRVSSDGAVGMRLAIDVDQPTTGAEMRFIESGPAGRVLGPIGLGGAAGTRWGPLTFGELVTVEVFMPPDTDLAREAFAIDLVSRLDTSPLAAAKAIGDAGPCEFDVACYSLSSEAGFATNATALSVVTDSHGSSSVCTATLMNTDPFSGTPYLLTAAYCVNDQAEASSLNTLWSFEATRCGSNVSQPTTQRTGGATLVARTGNEGISFLLMNDRPPSGAKYSGWSPTNPAVGQSVMAVHHPQGDLKKISKGSITAVDRSLSVRFTSGVTEGGSVGSGLFKDDQYLTGVLYAGLSACSNPTGLDYYVPFSSIWSTVGPYLRPAATPAPATTNYSDIWWNPSESGWGMTIADHETQLFAVWYTYDANGRPTWFVIPGGEFTQNRRIFNGTLYQTRGPCYREATFDPSRVTVTPVGSATIDFAPTDLPSGWARFSGSMGSTSWSKAITRTPFGNAAPDWGKDFTDIWWNSTESGWGLTLAQHGNNVFGVLFTYDCDGSPLFVVLPGVTMHSPSAFSGTLYTTTSRSGWWGSPTFDASGVTVTPVGTTSIAFSGRNGQFGYTINGATRNRAIAPNAFGNGAPPGPAPPQTLTVNLSGTGSGSVASAPAGINCGAACVAAFPDGTAVVLNATASPGSSFVGWGGDCAGAGAGACNIVMSSARNVVANFSVTVTAPPAPKACRGTYSLTVNISFMGCANPTYTFVGDISIDGLDFDYVANHTPSQFAGLLTVSNVSDMFGGFPGTCTPVNPGQAVAAFNGFMNISRIGSADAFVMGEELHFDFSLGSMNTVLGTITGPEVKGGHFSCNY